MPSGPFDTTLAILPWQTEARPLGWIDSDKAHFSRGDPQSKGGTAMGWLDGKVALVTGGGAGMRRASASSPVCCVVTHAASRG